MKTPEKATGKEILFKLPEATQVTPPPAEEPGTMALKPPGLPQAAELKKTPVLKKTAGPLVQSKLTTSDERKFRNRVDLSLKIMPSENPRADDARYDCGMVHGS